LNGKSRTMKATTGRARSARSTRRSFVLMGC
jgi:hypothetical protein